MPIIEEAFRLLGLGAPFIYAAATYGLFHHLDLQASPRAKAAVSHWVRSELYNKTDVAAVMLGVFDRIYTSPLFHIRAFIWSSIYSIVITIIIVYEFYPVIFDIAIFSPFMRAQWINQIVNNVIADYIALFPIRWWLRFAGRTPILAMLVVPVIGACIIYIIYIVRDVAGYSIETRSFEFIYFVQGTRFWIDAIESYSSTSRFLIIPAIVVYLWLPLFAISVLIVQVLNAIRRSAERTQWFLKRGQWHPLRAIGYVAASIVFIITTILRLLY